MQIMLLRWWQKTGNKPIVLMGGGTTRIGDPTGKDEARKMLTDDAIARNMAGIKKVFAKYLTFGDGASDALMVNNADWLDQLNYIAFLRDYGKHFTINRMLTFEAYRQRMETGLSFIEFNYQLLQSYDYLQLYTRHGCRLQIGGDDQWGNIVAGMELIRRVEGGEAYGLTFPLVQTSDGKKMGKTEKGALFLDPEMTSPYEFFQYWRNVSDADVEKFLLMFTFLPAPECRALAAGDINAAKERLALEVTAVIHGRDEADKALAGAKAAFGGGGDKSAMPTVSLPRARFEAGYPVLDLFVDSGLAPTKSEARRLVQQGGAAVGETLWADEKAPVGLSALDAEGELVLRAGKKRFVRIVAS